MASVLDGHFHLALSHSIAEGGERRKGGHSWRRGLTNSRGEEKTFDKSYFAQSAELSVMAVFMESGIVKHKVS